MAVGTAYENGKPGNLNHRIRVVRPRLGVAVSIAMALALFVLIPHLTSGHVNHDVAWYLLAARAWLEGAVLYRDVVDVNPPMIIYLTAPAAILARSLDVPLHWAFYLYFCVLLAGSLLWSGRILARSGMSSASTEALIVCLFVLTGLLPILEFGQREHFLMVLSLPYLLLALFAFAPRGTESGFSAGERLMLGAVAGLGFAVKPHFLIVPALLVLAQCAASKSPRPLFAAQSIGLGGIVAAYGAGIVLFHPDFLYFVVPLVTATYGAYGSSLAPYLLPAGACVLAFALAIVLAVRPASDRLGQPVYVAVLAAVGFAAGFLLQGKGWIYHAMPLAMWIGVALITGALVTAGPMRADKAGRAAAACAMALAVWAPLFMFSPHATLKARSDALVAALGPEATGRRIVSWSPKLNNHFPAVTRIDGQWSSRFQCLWPLPGAMALAASTDPSQAERGAELLSLVRRLAVDDFIAQRPEIVLTPRSIDVPGLFMEDSRFARHWARYRKISSVHALDIWIDGALAQTGIGRGVPPG